MKSVGAADVQPTQRFWVTMLYLELYLFIYFINCLRSSMGRTGDACPPAPEIGSRPGLVGGADNLLNLLPVSVNPWIKALVNRSDVVIVREADSQDTLQLNCWCLPSREEETRSVCIPQESVQNEQTLRYALQGTYAIANFREKMELFSIQFVNSVMKKLGDLKESRTLKELCTSHNHTQHPQLAFLPHCLVDE